MGGVGSHLNYPITNKFIQRRANLYYRVASAEMQGYRTTMEDMITISISDEPGGISFFGVFDGHAGSECSEFLSRNFHEKVLQLENPADPEHLVQVCLALDSTFLQKSPHPRESGSTACFAVIKPLFPDEPARAPSQAPKAGGSDAPTAASSEKRGQPEKSVNLATATAASRHEKDDDRPKGVRHLSLAIKGGLGGGQGGEEDGEDGVEDDPFDVPPAASPAAMPDSPFVPPATFKHRDKDGEGEEGPEPAVGTPSASFSFPANGHGHGHGNDNGNDNGSDNGSGKGGSSLAAQLATANPASDPASADEAAAATNENNKAPAPGVENQEPQKVPPLAHPRGYEITVGNVGDSRAVLLRRNGDWVALTRDHLPTDQKERNRIKAAGGTVSMGRVDGELAMSRAFGDGYYKNNNIKKLTDQKVIAVPDVTVAVAEPGDHLLLCCDGFFERLNRKQVCEFLHTEFTKSLDDPGRVGCELIDYSLHCGSGDNMSLILISFKPDQDVGDLERALEDVAQHNYDHFVVGQHPPARTANKVFLQAFESDRSRQVSRVKEQHSALELHRRHLARSVCQHFGQERSETGALGRASIASDLNGTLPIPPAQSSSASATAEHRKDKGGKFFNSWGELFAAPFTRKKKSAPGQTTVDGSAPPSSTTANTQPPK